MEPLISIIIPIYNVEKYLNECIDSVINQTYKNLEIILINDGSPDKCGPICDQYKLKDDRIIVIHQKNKGLSGARNSGLEVASGDYIGFVDSDDWIGEKMYEVMLNLLLKYDLDIIECEANQTNHEIDYKTGSYDVAIENSFKALHRIIKNSSFPVWRRLYKKEIIKDSRFVLNKTSEDVYFMIDNIPKTNKMGYYGFPFYNYRANPTSIMRSPYNLTRLDDSISAALYLKNELVSFISNNKKNEQGVKQKELLLVVQNFILDQLIYHYKMLNYYPEVDPKHTNRKKVKNLIDKNYFNSKNHSPYIKFAKFLPEQLFKFLIDSNKIRHKALKSNQFT
ncbi:glycosyltransferase family 2 protein [Gelidibacter maritimus]|uniref:Glycosyltransferase n=1 Tax=Gelidibacter maritimus TaxID=2761487 RepID=A0A7W2M6G2_9FLAO|nr:glycosyltransferase [Gelidibacter maritimus]MBA6153570.1 glycosyltransferase [Gelidibacter maritimus]